MVLVVPWLYLLLVSIDLCLFVLLLEWVLRVGLLESDVLFELASLRFAGEKYLFEVRFALEPLPAFEYLDLLL